MNPKSSSPPNRRAGRRAIVLGGGFAGLLTARALADHFDRVDILERDGDPDLVAPGMGETPDADRARRGVPQGNHAHMLMGGGMAAIERLMPGFEAELRQDGLRAVDFGRDLAWKQFGHWKSREASGRILLAQSRPALERRLRTRVLRRRSIHILWQHAVQGLCFDESGRRVVGVEVQDADGVPRSLPADLVVDASGAGSRTVRWLEAAGFDTPEEESVDLGLAYTSAVFRRPAHERWDWQMLLVSPKPGGPLRGGLIYPIDDRHWLVSLHGYAGDHAPTDLEGFLEFTRSLASSSVAHAVSRAELAGEIRRFTIPRQRRLRYDRITMPDRLLVLGDAVCRVDPAYGQGMTNAAREAEALAVLLASRARSRRPLAGLGRAFQRRVRELTELPWRLSGGYKATVRSSERGLRRRYWMLVLAQLRRVAEAGADPVAHQAFLRINHLVASPAVLFSPRVLGVLLRRRLRPALDRLLGALSRRASTATAGR